MRRQVPTIMTFTEMMTEQTTIRPYCLVRKLGESVLGAGVEVLYEDIERRVATTNRVGHPSLVQVSDCGHLPDGTTYIIMEYLQSRRYSAVLVQHNSPRGENTMRSHLFKFIPI